MGTLITRNEDDDRIERALAMFNEKVSAIDRILEVSGHAGIDIKRDQKIRFINQPDGTRIVEISCQELISRNSSKP